MQFEIEMASYAVLVPAGLSFAVAWGLLRVLPRDVAPLIAGAIGCAAGFFAGYGLLETANLRPTTYWHWLPWLGIVAALAGSVGLSPRVPIFVRWMLWLAVGIVSSWLLVPTWADLKPSRIGYVSIFAVCVFLVTVLIESLARRPSARLISLSLSLSSLCGAVLMAAFVSLRFGMLAFAAFAAVSGVCAMSAFGSTRDVVRGAALFYAVVIGGLMLTGQLVGVVPSVCFFLISAAPTVLWACEFGPLSRLTGNAAVIIRLAAIALPLTAAFVMAL